MQPLSRETVNSDVPITRRVTLAGSSLRQASSFRTMTETFNVNDQSNEPEDLRSFSAVSFNTSHFSIPQPQAKTASGINRSRSVGGRPSNFQEWARIYLFGHDHNTGVSDISTPP